MTGGHGEKLSRKREAAVAALLSESTIERAAARAGLGERTLRRWIREDHFREAYREARSQAIEVAVSRLNGIMAEAVETLRRNLSSGSPSVEVRAAAEIVSTALKGAEILDLAERLGRIEAVIAAREASDEGGNGTSGAENREGAGDDS